MSVLIKGMVMPKNCGECPMICDDDLCRITKGGRTLTERPPHCPLIPVPEHGRLIDADALRDKWIWGRTDRLGECECIELIDLDNAPTVIPASKEGET